MKITKKDSGAARIVNTRMPKDDTRYGDQPVAVGVW
jgi:hypothetical protein